MAVPGSRLGAENDRESRRKLTVMAFDLVQEGAICSPYADAAVQPRCGDVRTRGAETSSGERSGVVTESAQQRALGR